jgi:anti-sigma factor RsiW
VTVPGSHPGLGLRFVGLRNCLHHEGTMAHLMYDYRGHRLSLFVMPHTETVERDADVFGQQTHTWAAGGRGYALVAEGAIGDLKDVAEYLRHAVR